MAAVIDYCQRPLTGLCVGVDPSLVGKKKLFDGRYIKVGLLCDIEVSVEAVLFDATTEYFHVV